MRPALSVGSQGLEKLDSMQITEPMVMPSEARGLVRLSSAHSLIVSRWKIACKRCLFTERHKHLFQVGRRRNAVFIIGEKGVVILAVFKIERACHKGLHPWGGGKV